MTSLSIIFPWRDHPDRRDAFEYVRAHYRDELADFDPIITCVDDPGVTFNRGRAFATGVAVTTGDVLVFADADVWVPGANLRGAVELCQQEATGYVVPFDSLAMLSQPASRLVIGGVVSPCDVDGLSLDLLWDRLSTGGVNVLTRDAYERSGGFDPRFAGWGYEDAAFDAAMCTLVAPARHLSGRAVHLWHPIDDTRSNDELRLPALALCERYNAAVGDVAAMRALIDERSA